MHAHVELPERIGNDVDVDGFGLLPVPLGECGNVGEIVGIADPSRLARSERVLHRIYAGEVLDGEIRVAPKLDALVKVVQEDVVQLVSGYRRHEHHHDQSGAPQQLPAPAHHELPERGHRGILTAKGRAHPNGQKREQRRKQGHGEHERRADPERDEGAQLTKGRHLGEVHAKEADRGGQAREEYRLKIHPQRLDDRVPLELAPFGRAGTERHRPDSWSVRYALACMCWTRVT